MLGASVGLEDEARQLLLENCCLLLTVGIVDLNLAVFLAEQGPIADHAAGRAEMGQDWLPRGSALHLLASALKLFKKLTTIFYGKIKESITIISSN